MAEAARVAELPINDQEYARSMRTLMLWGGVLLTRGEVYLEKLRAYEQLNYDDYYSGLREMLLTDKELGRYFYINDTRAHRIINGRARAADGTLLADMIRVGAEKSAELAVEDPAYEPQAIRDADQLTVADRVDQLKPGQTLLAYSPAPEKELTKHRKIYHGRLGYRDDIGYIFAFSNVNGETLITRSRSVRLKDNTAILEILNEHGADIPAGADPSTYTRYTVELEATPEQARQFIEESIVNENARRSGTVREQYSITEYMKQYENVVKTFFNVYYPELAKATQSQQNNEIMESFAQAILNARIDKLEPKIRQQLLRVAKSEAFDKAMADTMETVIRYAVVEEMRKGLTDYINPKKVNIAESWPSRSVLSTPTQQGAAVYYLNRLLAGNVSNGVAAGRSYGGCPGNTNMTAEDGDDFVGSTSSTSSLQSTYMRSGSDSSREKWKTKKGQCAIRTCPTRPGRVEVGPCGVCMKRCQVLYDAGKDPAKMGSVTRKAGKIVTTPILPPDNRIIRSYNKNYETATSSRV